MTHNKLIKYTEKPEIMDLQEALGVPETGVMDQMTIQTLTMQIQESGFAESKYFTEKLEEEEVKTTEEAEALLFEIAAEAILKEFYKYELEKIAKFMKECYDSKMKEQGIEVMEVEYDPEYHGSREYQKIFEKGGRIYKFGGKSFLRYQGGSTILSYDDIKKLATEQGYNEKDFNKMFKGFTPDTKVKLVEDESGNRTFEVIGKTTGRGLFRRSGLFGLRKGDKAKDIGEYIGLGFTGKGLNARREAVSDLFKNASVKFTSDINTDPEQTEKQGTEYTFKKYGDFALEMDASGTSKSGKFKEVDGELFMLDENGVWKKYKFADPDEQEQAKKQEKDDESAGGTGGSAYTKPTEWGGNNLTEAFQKYALAKGNTVGSRQQINQKESPDNIWKTYTQRAYDKLGSNFMSLYNEEGIEGINRLYNQYLGGNAQQEDTTSDKETEDQNFVTPIKEESSTNFFDNNNAFIEGETPTGGSGTPVVTEGAALDFDKEIKNAEQKLNLLDEKLSSFGLGNLMRGVFGNKWRVMDDWKYVAATRTYGKENLEKLKQLYNSYSKQLKEFKKNKNLAELKKSQKELEDFISKMVPTKKQGGTIFSKFKKGGTIEIPEKTLESVLKNIVGSGLKKKDGIDKYKLGSTFVTPEMTKPIKNRFTDRFTQYPEVKGPGLMSNPVVTLVKGNKSFTARKGTPEYDSYIKEGFSELPNIEPVTQEQRDTRQETKYATQKISTGPERFYDRTNSLANLLKTSIDAGVASQYKMDVQPIGRKFFGDVQTKLMRPSNQTEEVQEAIARVVNANNLVDPAISLMGNKQQLDALNRAADSEAMRDIQMKENVDDIQFKQRQNILARIDENRMNMQGQQQEINNKKKMIQAEIARDLAQAAFDFNTGAYDSNEQAVMVNVYNECLNKQSVDKQAAIQQYQLLLEEIKKDPDNQELQAQRQQLADEYSSAKSSVEECVNSEVNLERSRAAGFENLGVKKVDTAYKKGGKLDFYKVKVKQAIEAEKNATKKDITTIKVLQDYYKMINKVKQSDNKDLSKILNNIIK